MIKDEAHYFCCKGCQGIYHLLADEGLDNFYEKVGDTKLTPPTEQFEDSGNFNSSAFYDRFVKTNREDFQEVSLIIEGIHCAACVWLNEKALHKMDGIVEVHINYTNNKANITWADEVVKLSSIIDMIRAIGYNAFPYDPSLQEAHANKERKDFYLRMAVATFASMNVMWVAVAQYAGYFTGIRDDVRFILNIAEWALSTPVLFYSGWIFFRGAYYGLRNKVVNMDLLVSTGAALTYIYSIYITFANTGEAYFDSVTMIITFVLLGKFLEVLSKKSAADTLDVMSKHLPSEVMVLRAGNFVNINVNEAVAGDVIQIKSGEKVALDGEVSKGEGSFDESNLSGESEPIFKKLGDKLLSGTVSLDATLQYRAVKDFAHSTLSNLVTLLESSMAKKPKIEQMANKLSEHFSTAILLLAFLTFLVWFLLGNPFETSFIVGISVIVIACPCALALATPVATLVGIGLGAKRGILFKQAAQLETMANIDMLLLDKTGTLTEGRPDVQRASYLKEFDKALLFSLASSSKHPVSVGISRYLMIEHEFKMILALDALEQISARGMKANYENHILLGGNAELMRENGIKVDENSDMTLYYFAINGELCAILELKDSIKKDALDLIESMKSKNIDVVMLTGDHERVAKEVAGALGIENYKAALTPKEKADYISHMHNQDKKVVMVGDGVNDILALAQADIGIAMGSGSDIAIDVSDVVLMNDSLTSLNEAFKISTTTFKLIKQNLGISLVYNAVTIPLAMAGYIIPLIAAISMSISSLLVVGNSLRIRLNWKKG